MTSPQVSRWLDDWQNVNLSESEREHAMWYYWTARASDRDVIDDLEWSMLLGTSVRGLCNVLGLLAECDRIPEERMQSVEDAIRSLQSGRQSDDARFAARRLAARRVLRRFVAGVATAEELIEAVVQKGASSAALEAARLLDDDSRQRLMIVSEREKVFSRYQRHQLRELCRRARPDRGGSPEDPDRG